MFLAAVRAINAVDRLKGNAFGACPPLNWAELQAWKTTFTEKITPGKLKKFDEQGVVSYFGSAQFTALYGLEVGGGNGVQ